jgi:hypothetical protein
MAFKWSNLSHKTSPEKREQLKQDEVRGLAETNAQHRKDNILREFGQRLKSHGISDEAVETAIAKMKAAGEGRE